MRYEATKQRQPQAGSLRWELDQLSAEASGQRQAPAPQPWVSPAGPEASRRLESRLDPMARQMSGRDQLPAFRARENPGRPARPSSAAQLDRVQQFGHRQATRSRLPPGEESGAAKVSDGARWAEREERMKAKAKAQKQKEKAEVEKEAAAAKAADEAQLIEREARMKARAKAQREKEKAEAVSTAAVETQMFEREARMKAKAVAHGTAADEMQREAAAAKSLLIEREARMKAKTKVPKDKEKVEAASTTAAGTPPTESEAKSKAAQLIEREARMKAMAKAQKEKEKAAEAAKAAEEAQLIERETRMKARAKAQKEKEKAEETQPGYASTSAVQARMTGGESRIQSKAVAQGTAAAVAKDKAEATAERENTRGKRSRPRALPKAPPVRVKLVLAARPRKGRSGPVKRQMESFGEWLDSEDGQQFAELKETCREYYTKEKGGRKRREQEKKIEQSLAVPVMEMMMGEDPKATQEEKMKKRAEDTQKKNACVNYPSRQELLEHYGCRCGPFLNQQGAGQTKKKPNKWEYPKHPDKMDCAKFVRTGKCEKFEQSGYCPFNHPYNGPAAPLSGKLVCSAVAEDYYRVWLEAARSGDKELLAGMIEGGPDQPEIDINWVAEPGTGGVQMDLQGKSAASMCAKLGHCDCLELLLKSGASRKKSKHEIHSLLFSAATNNKSKHVKGGAKDVQKTLEICLANRIPVTEVDSETGQTVLHFVIDKMNFGIIPFLIKRGADIDRLDQDGFSPLHKAAAKGSLETCQILLTAKAEVNTQATQKDMFPCPGSSPLGTACKKGVKSVVQLLLSHKAVVDANAVVNTLTLTDKAGSEEIMKLLDRANTSKRPLIMSKNKDRSGAVHVACAIANEEKGLAVLTQVMELSEAAGKTRAETVNAQNLRGVCALSVACRTGNLVTIRYLLTECEANAWLQDDQGNTALHHTENLLEGSDKVIELVCKRGGGEKLVEVTNKLGNTPMLPSKMSMEACKMQ